MYNRYIRDDSGAYTRMPQEDIHHPPSPAGAHEAQPRPSAMPPLPQPKKEQRPNRPAELKIVSKVLDMLHLGDIDAGDLILLLLLFVLFHENGDEELLIAIGLLLIL